MAKRGRPRHPNVLTPREWEVLDCIRDGLSNDEIAERLGISLDGVKYHVTEILTKLGLENRHDAARWRPARAALPLLFWRRLGARWLSPAIAGSLAAGLAVGAGLLAWALITTSGQGAKTAADAPATPSDNRPLVGYAVVALSTDPLAPLSLKAIDPFTGADVPGRAPIELGHDGVEALSPDGSTIALGWAAADTGGAGPQRLSLLDVRTWTKRDTDFLDGISRLFWSPDGKTVYVQTYQCAQSICNFADTRLVSIDAATGNVESSFALPSYTDQSFLSPDGSTFYVFGSQFVDPQVAPNPPAPQLASIDVATGHIIAERSFAEILDGSRLEHDASGDHYAFYQPGVAMSHDGQRMYVGYPDSNRIAVVDLAAMQIERTAEIGRKQTSLLGRFLSLFASKAEAKGGPADRAVLYFSLDGRRLYYRRTAEHPPADANLGNYDTTTVGPWLLDANSLDVTAELKAPNMDTQLFLSDVSDKYIFALRGLNVVVLDPNDLHEISGGAVGAAVFDLLVGPSPPP